MRDDMHLVASTFIVLQPIASFRMFLKRREVIILLTGMTCSGGVGGVAN